ncbi:NAD(P)H-binding protein [Halobacillus shinanisalinarum]|uniref:NAD(P)H-binding protein n=1 Tax=Halobacillus shinanisalinarum TaxID=2932258 RepID=A0ABY4GXP6_9BACI|nr:NAD(P)H-binding protein [Halobacillus shinanisalinarum]UOQ92721.1 NAD(P)H-binding protein [Halobacillus shinanisalinarum]
MKLAVFGATGRVGSRVVNMAVRENIEVNAHVRDIKRAEQIIPEANLIKGDVTKSKDVEATLRDCELVFSALGTDKTDTLSKAIPIMIQLMKKHQVERIITIGTAGILNSRFEENKFRFETNESKRRLTFAAEEHLSVFKTLSQSSLSWTILCPTYLPDGEAEGRVRYEQNFLPEGGKKITVGDTAQFAFQEIKTPRFPHLRVGLSD